MTDTDANTQATPQLLQETASGGVAERVYRRRDGSRWSEFSVRYRNEHGERARAVFDSRAAALEFKAAVAYARRHRDAARRTSKTKPGR